MLHACFTLVFGVSLGPSSAHRLEGKVFRLEVVFGSSILVEVLYYNQVKSLKNTCLQY